MKVYSMNVSTINPDDKKWYRHLSEKRILKVNRLKKKEHKAQSIGAELLLNYAVRQEFGGKGIVKWETDSIGKLYLTEYPGIYVNLSHSGDYAVCAVNTAPVGIDIQKRRECDIKMAERFFTVEEVKFINDSADRSSAFFEIWTKKESFVKAIGTGLTIPLNSFSVLADKITYDGQEYQFRKYSVSQKGYELFVCCRS